MTELNTALFRFLSLALVLLSTLACTEPAPTVEAEASATEEKTEMTVNQEPETTRQARTLIREAIVASGLENMDEAAYSFGFRDKTYRYQQTGGKYTYERWWTDTTTNSVIRDVLNNDGFVRYTDGEETEVTEKKRKAYSNSVNSVIYFAFLPAVLEDPAVIPSYLGRDTIKGEVLDQIEVVFTKENGGDDAGDEFRYWFTPKTRQLKYLAYVEPGGKSPRLRQATNERTVAGIVVRDYDNYRTPKNAPSSVEVLGDAFNRGELELLSEIDLFDIRKLDIQENRQRGDAPLDQ